MIFAAWSGVVIVPQMLALTLRQAISLKIPAAYTRLAKRMVLHTMHRLPSASVPRCGDCYRKPACSLPSSTWLIVGGSLIAKASR